MGSHFLLQGIFPSQALNPHRLHWQVDSLPLSHQGRPMKGTDLIEWRHREGLWEQEDHRRFSMWPCLWAGRSVCRSPSWLHQLQFNKHHGDPCIFFPLTGTLSWVGMFKTPSTHTLPDWWEAIRHFILLCCTERVKREKKRRQDESPNLFCLLKGHKNVIDVK